MVGISCRSEVLSNLDRLLMVAGFSMISGGSLEYTRSLPVVPKKLRLLPKLGTTPVFSVRRTGRVLSPTGGTAVVLAVAEGAAGITGVPTRVLSSTAGRTCVFVRHRRCHPGLIVYAGCRRNRRFFRLRLQRRLGSVDLVDSRLRLACGFFAYLFRLAQDLIYG